MAELDASIPLRSVYQPIDAAGLLEQRAQIQLRNLALQKQQRQEELAQQQQSLRNQAGQLAAQGQLDKADQLALGSGDFDLHSHIKGLQDEQRAQVARRTETLAKVGLSVRQLPYEQRKAAIGYATPLLAQAGLQPDQIAAFDPTDQNIDALLGQVRSVDAALAAHDKQNEPFTLGQDQVRFGANGQVIARGPESIKAITTPEGGTTTVFGGAGHTGFGGNLSLGNFLPAIMAQESGGNYSAVNKSTGALGAYQVMPATAQTLSQRLGLQWRPDLMTASTPEARQYQDAIGKAAAQEAINASGGDPAVAAAYYHGGSDRSKWGAKTQQYAQQVVAKLGGNGPVTINGRPKADDSKAPVGYRYKPDGNLEPIPGGPADTGTVEMPAPKELAKRNAAYPKVSGAFRTASQKIDQQISDVQTLLNHPGFNNIFGVLDAHTPNLTGNARAAQAIYDRVAARAQFNELQDMRNSSPTGGALGQVSDSENKTLRQAAAALARNQDEADARERLKDYLYALQTSRANLQQTYDDTYAYRNAQRPASPAAGGNRPSLNSIFGG